MDPDVKKIWYDINTINYQYDITQTQPQLFVTETFQNLIDVLEAFADTMAFRRGGAESILKAIECKNPSTAVYSSGLQVTGVFTDVGLNKEDELTFIKTTGPSALAFANKQLDGHGKDYHSSGFSSPVGKLKGIEKPLENHTTNELELLGIANGSNVELNFESGINLIGVVKNIIIKEDKLILIAFENCTVKEDNGNVLFQPEWGTYDMAIGEKIVSVFNGAADKDAYEELVFVSKAETRKTTYDDQTQQLHQIYMQVRNIRENAIGYEELPILFNELKTKYRTDWLSALEMLEIVYHNKLDANFEKELRIYLEMKAATEPDHSKLINDGLHIIANPVSQLITEED
jgi:phenylalanine-4-hydroxylase